MPTEPITGWLVYDHNAQRWLPGTLFLSPDQAEWWIKNARLPGDYEAVPVTITLRRGGSDER